MTNRLTVEKLRNLAPSPTFVYGDIEMMADSDVENELAVKIQPQGPNSALHLAGRVANKELAEVLIHHGADVNAKDSNGKAPLHYVAAFNSKSAALIAADDFDGILEEVQREIGFKPAVDPLLQKPDVRGTIELLVSSGARVNEKADEGGHTPLHLAVMARNMEAVSALVEKGADWKVEDDSGRKPAGY